MSLPLRSVKATNFRSLGDVTVDFGELNVLIGPNGSGKSNLLKVLSFVRDTARFDIGQAIAMMGGVDHVIRRAEGVTRMSLQIDADVTEFAGTKSRDSYTLTLEPGDGAVEREESFKFKRVRGQGRRYVMSAKGREVTGGEDRSRLNRQPLIQLSSDDVSALGAVARVHNPELGDGPAQFFSFLSGIRYLEPDVERARTPSRISTTTLADDASNLSAALYTLREQAPDSFQDLVRDLSRCLPGLDDIVFEPYGGSTSSVLVRLQERGLSDPIDLADASFGTVRALALLVALHEQEPPALTVIEEVDHGLHPYALDVIVDRMRESSTRTQLLVASHSPTLVNRLDPSEIIVCDRDPETGASVIPAISSEEIAEATNGSDWQAGELWFSGILGGVPR